jgi:hypothetical protein
MHLAYLHEGGRISHDNVVPSVVLADCLSLRLLFPVEVAHPTVTLSRDSYYNFHGDFLAKILLPEASDLISTLTETWCLLKALPLCSALCLESGCKKICCVKAIYNNLS